MYIGEYNHTIDTKGRLIVTVKFREQLGDKFVVTKGLDGCLSLYDMNAWNILEEKLSSLPMTNPSARKLSRFMLAGASECELDKMGRILIPQVLRNAASLEKDVVLVGVGTKIEIWDKSKWIEANSYDDMSEIAESLEGFGI